MASHLLPLNMGLDGRITLPTRSIGISVASIRREGGEIAMYNIFYIIGVIVVVLFILGYLGLR
jgi:hypothetical protein